MKRRVLDTMARSRGGREVPVAMGVVISGSDDMIE